MMKTEPGIILSPIRLLLLLAAAVGMTACAGAQKVNVRAIPDPGAQKTQDAQAATELRLARASRTAGDYVSALNLYRAVISVAPTDVIEVELGDTLTEANAPEEAIDIYAKIGAASPSRIAALMGMTRANLDLSEPEKALGYAEQARRLAPVDARVLVAYGVTLDMLGRHGEAQQSYRAVLSKAPHDIPARNDLALSLSLTGQYDEAAGILAPIVKSATATPRVRQNLALIYGLMGDRERAAALSRIDLDQNVVDANLRFFDFVEGRPGN